ncbi:flagellar filament capping protein FliD [Cohnella mopanensis]|uniref:flagellar filament capping protein FliD n=1 Tax=Cohnella mopanensis TaxID=2911966 RepID=UPI001EF86896|nr:flagellar filament capping protein FliD [Cohnella mopanensis]
MYYSSEAVGKVVPPVSPYIYSPFSRSAYRQPANSWLNSYPNPYKELAKSAAIEIASFLSSTQDVQSSANNLLRSKTSSIQAREVLSSNPNTVVASANNGASVKAYRIQVQSIADKQTNSGAELNRESLSGIQSGANAFKITVGSKSKSISVQIATQDTNEQALTKLRDAINDAKTGVTARVITDSDGGTSRLELKSDRTGTDRAFEVEDTVGNAVSSTGMFVVTSAAKNASFKVNGGEEQTSKSNVIELEKGKVTATLLEASTDVIEIKVRPDEKEAIEQVGKMISSYNAMRDRLNEAGGFLSPAVRKSLDNAVDSRGDERIGIMVNADGSLRLDEVTFKIKLNADYEQTNKALVGRDGLADRLVKATERFNDASASALVNKQIQAMQQFATYQSSMQAYLPFPTTGLLVNRIL